MSKAKSPAALSYVDDQPRPPVTPRKGTLTEHAYRRLAQDIVAGRLVPGQKLTFEMLRRDYGCGISPLREALQRLTSESLVEAEGHIGFRVAPISLRDLEDVNALRSLLEPMALRDAVVHGGMEWETEVVAAAHKLRRMPLPENPTGSAADEWDECHRQFHDALISACSSRWLLQFCRTLFAQFGRYRRLILTRYWNSATLRSTIDGEHKRLVEAALARDPETAARLLAKHYANSAARVVAEYRKRIANEREEAPARDSPKKSKRRP